MLRISLIVGYIQAWKRQQDDGGGQFIRVAQLEDGQAVRAVTFSPDGSIFALGSNSKVVRICAFPNDSQLR